MIRLLPAAILLALAASSATAEVLFAEDFSGDAPLAERGWTVEAEPEQSEWSIEGDHLRAVCHRSPYQGGRIVREVPVTPRGVLEFDALFAEDGGVNYDHLCLGVKLYGQMWAFKKMGGHLWMAYRPDAQNWYVVTPDTPLGQWAHLRIVFDISRSRVEYYLGDAPDPLMIATDLAMAPEGETGELEVFNYGLTKGTVTNLVDDIVLRSIDEAAASDAERTHALVFSGITSVRYRAVEALQEVLGPDRLRAFTLSTRGAATFPRNKLALSSVPGASTWAQARLVVLEDVPAGPGEVLPAFLLDDMERAVRDGAHLLVLAGPFSLGKGAWAGTALAEMLPVEVGGPWDLRRLDQPLPLSDLPGSPAVRWHHEVAAADGSTIGTLSAGTVPMVVTRPLGEGLVTVFLAAPMGNAEDYRPLQPFWEWDGWPDLLRSLARVEGGVAQ